MQMTLIAYQILQINGQMCFSLFLALSNFLYVIENLKKKLSAIVERERSNIGFCPRERDRERGDTGDSAWMCCTGCSLKILFFP